MILKKEISERKCDKKPFFFLLKDTNTKQNKNWTSNESWKESKIKTNDMIHRKAYSSIHIRLTFPSFGTYKHLRSLFSLLLSNTNVLFLSQFVFVYIQIDVDNFDDKLSKFI